MLPGRENGYCGVAFDSLPSPAGRHRPAGSVSVESPLKTPLAYWFSAVFQSKGVRHDVSTCVMAFIPTHHGVSPSLASQARRWARLRQKGNARTHRSYHLLHVVVNDNHWKLFTHPVSETSHQKAPCGSGCRMAQCSAGFLRRHGSARLSFVASLHPPPER